MTELVDLLAADTDLLPGQAAEHIALGRLAAKERKRTAQRHYGTDTHHPLRGQAGRPPQR